MRIGLFDSGIGGITILQKIMNNYNNVEYLYYADTLNLPFGEKTKEELLSIGKNIISFLEEKGVDLIIIACGTCSSLIDEYREMTTISILDVISPTVSYVKEKHKSVGLLATEATIKNGTFEDKLTDQGIEVISIPCGDFVPYIEGLTENIPNLNKLDILKDNVEAIILGCTHYPLLKDKIESYTGIPTIDMGNCITQKINVSIQTDNHVTVYVSKTTPDLEERIETLLGADVDIVNLDNKLKKTI